MYATILISIFLLGVGLGRIFAAQCRFGQGLAQPKSIGPLAGPAAQTHPYSILHVIIQS